MPTGSGCTGACAMGFWSIFTGNSPGLTQATNQFNQIGGFGTSLGESNLGQSSKFWSSILSGNSAKQAQVLAPEISAQQKQLQQGEKTAAEFHNRGGGVNSTTQAAQGEARGNITNLIGNLQTTAAGNLQSSGSNLLSQAMEATGESAALSEEQLNNWQNSIFGKAISGGIGAAEGFGLGTAFNTINPSVFSKMSAG